MTIGRMKIKVDSSNAQSSVNGLSNSWTNANQAVELVSRGMTEVASVLTGLNDIVLRSADFFSQMGHAGDGARAKLDLMRHASGDMIKSTSILTTINTLQRNGLELTTEVLESLAKASVTQGRAMNKSTESIMTMFTNAITTGRISTINKMGFNLDELGTIAEKQERIIGALTDRYKDLSVAAGDASEQASAATNRFETTMMLEAKKYEAMSEHWTYIKEFWKESALSIVTLTTKAERLHTHLLNMSVDYALSLGKATRHHTDMVYLQSQYNDMLYHGTGTHDKQLIQLKRIEDAQRRTVKETQAALDNARVIYLEKKKAGKEYFKELDTVTKIKIQLREHTALLKIKIAQTKAISDNMAEAQTRLKAQFFTFLDGVSKSAKTARKLAEDRAKANETAIKNEQQIRSGYREQRKELDLIIGRLGSLATSADLRKRQEFDYLITATNRERKLFNIKQKTLNELSNRRKQLESDNEKAAEIELKRIQKKNDALKKNLKLRQEMIDIQGKWAIADIARIESMHLQSIKNESLTGQARIQLSIAETQKRLAFEMSGSKDPAEIARLKENIETLRTQKMVATELGTTFKAMSSNIAKGLSMESSELRRLGKTRSQYILDTTATLLKAKAIEYGLKAVGALAEGLWASAIPGGQASAALFYAASKKYFIAAGLAGVGGVALSKSAGAVKGGGGGSQAPATATAGVGAGNRQADSKRVVNIYISQGVIFGDSDAAAKQIKAAIGSAEERGII